MTMVRQWKLTESRSTQRVTNTTTEGLVTLARPRHLAPGLQTPTGTLDTLWDVYHWLGWQRLGRSTTGRVQRCHRARDVGWWCHGPSAGRVDNDGAGNVDDSRINGLPEDVVGRNPPVGPVSTDEVNSHAGSIDVTELTVQGDDVAVHSAVDGVYNEGTGNVWYAVSPSTVAVANVEAVVSIMGFAGLDEGNGDAGQHGQPGSPGMNNDVVPVLGVHGPPVQGDADRCAQAITPGTLADDDYGSGPKRCSFGSGGLLVDEGRSTRNADAAGADVPVSGSMGHGQHGWSTATGQGYRGLCHLNNGVGAGNVTKAVPTTFRSDREVIHSVALETR